jgi:hypothetical protein
MENRALITISEFAKETNKYHNSEFINLIINLLENKINNNIIILNLSKNGNGYITDTPPSDDDSFYDDDKSFYSDEYYDEDELLEGKMYDNNKNHNHREIQNKYEKIGVKSLGFHKKFNDHKFHGNCQRCKYNCKKYNYICAMTIPNFNSIDKHGQITQYSKCGWSGMENNCVHDCKGLYLKDKNTIVRFRRDILTGNFNDDYFIEKLYNNSNHKYK